MKNRTLIDSGKSIRLFLLVFISYALIYMTKNCYSAAMASIVDEGIMSKSETGLIAAMFYLVYAPFQIIGGIAVDRYSPAKLVSVGIIGAAASNLAIYFTDNYVAMIVIWSLNAIVQFGVWPGIFKIISTELKFEHRMMGIFYISMASTVGLILSYLCAAVISYWKYNFLMSAILLFVLALIFILTYSRLSRSMVEDEHAERLAAISSRKTEHKTGALGVMLRAGMPLLLIVNLIHSALNLGIKALAPVMLMESYEAVSPALANVLNIILIIAGPVGLLASHNPAFRRISSPTAMAVLLAVVIPLMTVTVFIGRISIVFIIIALTLLMVCTGAMSIFFSYMSRAFERYGCAGTVAGTFNCMASLGIVLANYVFARLAEEQGWQFTIICWLAVTGLALVLCLASIPAWKKFTKEVI